MEEQRRREVEIARARDRDRSRAANLHRRAEMRSHRVLICSSLYLLTQSKKARRRAKRRQRRAVLLLFGMGSKKKRSNRADVDDPENSEWSRFFSNPEGHSDEAWFDWVGLPHAGFQDLVDICQEAWKSTPLREGDGPPRDCDLKKRQLDCHGTVALLLAFMTKPSLASDVGHRFGLIDTTCSKYLLFAIRIMLPVLREHPDAAIRWDVQQVEYLDECAKLVARYEPDLERLYGQKVIAWIDGVRFAISNKWSDSKERKKDQTKEKKRTLRKIILLIDPTGRCVAAAWNIPGRWNESRGCHHSAIYSDIERLPESYCVAADTAYKGSVCGRRILRCLKVGEFLPDGMTEDELNDRERLVIRVRQPSEWANNQLKQFVRRLCCVLSTDDAKNGQIMELAILLNNWRIHHADRNQVKRFFQNLEIFDNNQNLAEYLPSEDEEEEESGSSQSDSEEDDDDGSSYGSGDDSSDDGNDSE